MTREVVPVAYITKWAKTAGILTWENGYTLGSRYLFSPVVSYSIPAKHWTTDKATAEARWRQAVETEAKRLKAAAKKYEVLSKGAPVYAKEEG